MSFEEIVDGRMNNRQISITIAHLEHFVLRWANNKVNANFHQVIFTVFLFHHHYLKSASFNDKPQHHLNSVM